jgi:pyruvate,orthophosphate dikinase
LTGKRELDSNGVKVKEGDWISIDGASGEAYLGELKLSAASLEEQTDLLTLLDWADEVCARPGTRQGPAGWPTTGRKSGRMLITPRMLSEPVPMARRALALAGPSTCS